MKTSVAPVLRERKRERGSGFIRSVVISGYQFLSEQKTPGTHLHPLAALMFPSADHGLFLGLLSLVTADALTFSLYMVLFLSTQTLPSPSETIGSTSKMYLEFT